MEKLKPRDASRMRLMGELSGIEYQVINNMWGRGLKASIDDKTIAFYNGGNQPVAEVQRGTNVARLYPAHCGSEDNATRYSSGIEAVVCPKKLPAYDVARC
ncbi:MAG: hypothetical protein V1729_05905 [Candidatus Woesearchaeota archaeon]